MNINVKKFISIYGIRFVLAYLFAFFVLVTFFGRFEFQTFPGDLLMQRETFAIYLPFTSALAFAVFFIIIFEVYKNLR